MNFQDHSNDPTNTRTTPNEEVQDDVSDNSQNHENQEFEQQEGRVIHSESQQAFQNHLHADFSNPVTQNNTSRHENDGFDGQKLTPKNLEEQRNEMTPSDSQPNNGHSSEGTSSRYYGGSLDNLNADSKRESNAFNKDRNKLPTFGEDDFDNAVTRQLNNSPANKSKMTKLERLLEDHKRRRANKTTDYSNKNEEPFAFTANNPQGNTTSKPNNFQSHDYDTVIEEENGNIEEQNNHNQVSGVYSSIKLDGIHQGFVETPQITSHEKRQPSHSPESLFSHEKTGRFAESPIQPELIINTSNFESARDTKRKSEKTERLTRKVQSEKKLMTTPKARKISQDLEEQRNSNRYIPKISENSQKIYQNSGRAKEDELIIQEIIAARLKLVEANKPQGQALTEDTEENANQQEQYPKVVTRNSILDKIHSATSKTAESPESTPKRGNKNIQFEKTDQSSRGSPSPKVKFEAVDATPEKRTSGSNWSSPGVFDGQKSERSKPSPIKDLNTSKGRLNESSSTINNIVNGSRSPKKSSLKKTFQYLESFATATGPSLLLSPKNVTSNTIVEHKKSPSLANSNGKNAGDKSNVPPTAREIKELANMTKQIYVKVVDTRSENVLNGTSSPKNGKDKNAQQDPISSEMLRKLVQKADGVLSPEELKQFDEVQRLEIMLYNLKQMQQANLISQINVVRRTSSPKVTINESTFSDKQSWNQYADTINEGASGRRSIRKKKEEERVAKYARSASPQPMEKLEPTQESLVNSIQMRQQLYSDRPLEADGKTFQGALIKSWDDVGLYERHMLWLSARNQKVDQLNVSINQEGMKDCSFKPTFFTKRSGAGDVSQNMTANFSARNQMDAERSGFLKDKSLYKEKKALEHYTELFGLKKDYNVYKSEFFLPNRSQLM